MSIARFIPPLDRAAVLSGMMLAAYLGLAQGQERMERALVDALAAGGAGDAAACVASGGTWALVAVIA